MFSATCTHRTGSKSQQVKEMCIISDQACFILAVADGSVLARLWKKAQSWLTGVATEVAKVRSSGHWRTSLFSDLYVPAGWARQCPHPSLLPTLHTPHWSAALLHSSLPHFHLLSFLWSSPKEWEYFATIMMVVVLFALTLCFTLSICPSLLSPNYSNEKHLFSSQFYVALLMTVLSQNPAYFKISVFFKSRGSCSCPCLYINDF